VFIKINQFIPAPELRVLDEQGKQVGVMSKSAALQKAAEYGVDLVEIAPKANPPVAKLIDFAKFKYQLAQKAQEEKKKAKISEIKELRFTPVIAQGDFDNRVRRAKEFLADGDKVRFVVKFIGRQITRKDLGERILTRAIESVSDISIVEIPFKQIGKIMMTQVTPVKKKKTQ